MTAVAVSGTGALADLIRARVVEAADGVVVDLGQGGPAATGDRLAAGGITHLVYVSSAAVYGAWPDNPVPLSEEASLRPNPGFAYAAAHAEAERLVGEWKAARPDVTATILRPAVVVGPGCDRVLFAALTGLSRLPHPDGGRPLQFLHADDLIAAISLAVAARLDGPYNVAPDGWVSDETARALAGGPARWHLPGRLARVVAAAGRIFGIGRPVPGSEPYTRHPWVVANDRLKAAGWRVAYSNEEAFVAATPERELSPKRRQELALGVAAVALGGVAAGIARLIRRHRA